MSARLGGWRPALRIAWRDALRHRGRSILVLVMISLPVLAVSVSPNGRHVAVVHRRSCCEHRLRRGRAVGSRLLWDEMSAELPNEARITELVVDDDGVVYATARERPELHVYYPNGAFSVIPLRDRSGNPIRPRILRYNAVARWLLLVTSEGSMYLVGEIGG